MIPRFAATTRFARRKDRRRTRQRKRRNRWPGLHILPTLGVAKVDRLEPRHIREWHAGFAKTGLSSVTVAKVYRLLRSILSTAVEDRLLASNPCQIRNGGVERSKERPIPTLDQYHAVYEELPAHLAAVATLAAFAGLRKGEILGLERRHIDLSARSLRHPAWNHTREAAGLNDLRLHDLRNLAGTLTAQAGATLKETMAWLGHSSINAALRYQHVAENRHAEIAGRMDQLVRRSHNQDQP